MTVRGARRYTPRGGPLTGPHGGHAPSSRRKGSNGKGEYLDLKSVIRSRYPSLPGNQRKIADYLIHHLQEAPFLSVVDLERRTGTSRATVVRLARSLGFAGFLELRSRLLASVQTQLTPAAAFPIPAGKGLGDTLTAVAQQDVRNINHTINQLERESFAEIAGMILKAGRVHTAGLGISSLMAQILAYSLNQAAVRAVSFVHDYETFMEQLAFVTGHDLLIVFSFPPYSRETIDLARAAASRKIPVVALTDRVTSPVSFHATKVLAIRSKNMLFTNSFSAISVVINALVTEVALRNRVKALRLQRQVEKLLKETGHFTTE
jgi:DNA-binding MurR/RpiR family transcriptional regulator